MATNPQFLSAKDVMYLVKGSMVSRPACSGVLVRYGERVCPTDLWFVSVFSWASPLDCEICKSFSVLPQPPLRWQKMARLGWSWILPSPRLAGLRKTNSNSLDPGETISRGQVFLRAECSGIVQNGSFSSRLPLLEARGNFSSIFTVKNGQVTGGKTHKIVGVPYDSVPLEFQALYAHWPSSNLLITVEIFIPWHWFLQVLAPESCGSLYWLIGLSNSRGSALPCDLTSLMGLLIFQSVQCFTCCLDEVATSKFLTNQTRNQQSWILVKLVSISSLSSQ